MMDEKQAAALRAPFPPEQIGHLPRAGMQLDYVGHAAVTSRILEVDPGWSWKPMVVDEAGAPVFAQTGLSSQTKMGLWIEMTISDVTRPGFGDGNTVKECISDAIRNAAMRFGVALDLWAKEDLQASGSGAATAGGTPKGASGTSDEAKESGSDVPGAASNGPKLITDAQRRRLFKIAETEGVDEERLRDLIFDITGDRTTAMPAAKYDEVVQAVKLDKVPFE